MELHSVEQLKILTTYLSDLRIDRTEFLIPLGLDYECQFGNCNKNYNSLNSVNSPSLSSIIEQKLNKDSFFNQQWSNGINHKETQCVGLGFGKTDQLVEFPLDGKLPAFGLFCSTNAQNSDENVVSVTCDSVVRGNNQFDGISNTNILVLFIFY